jgi:type II secretory pathway component PulF
MADAGIALDDGLAQLARDVESPKLRGWLDALADDLRGGQTLEQAIARREDRLPLLYSQVIRARAFRATARDPAQPQPAPAPRGAGPAG